MTLEKYFGLTQKGSPIRGSQQGSFRLLKLIKNEIRIKGVRDQPPKLSDITLVLIPSTQKRMMIDVKEYQITL